MSQETKLLKIHLKPKEGLTLQAIRDLGWEQKAQVESTTQDSVRTQFEKGNFIILVYSTSTDVPVIEVFAKDLNLITYMMEPERFRVTMKCPTVEVFKIITENI